jgi:hypothetical protein
VSVGKDGCAGPKEECMGWASQTVASRHMSVGTAHLSEGGLSGMALWGTVVATNQMAAWAGEAVGQRMSGRRTPKAAHGSGRWEGPTNGCSDPWRDA